jgi:hypothetical protein
MICGLCASFPAYREAEVGLHRACAANARHRFVGIEKDTPIFGNGYDYVFALKGRRKAKFLFDPFQH